MKAARIVTPWFEAVVVVDESTDCIRDLTYSTCRPLVGHNIDNLRGMLERASQAAFNHQLVAIEELG